MADTSIFIQYPLFTRFILPFLLVFALVFGILEKTKVLGDGKKSLNAIIAFVVGLIVITALSPTVIISNLVLFLSVALVIVFIVLMIWSFMSGEEGITKIMEKGPVKWILFGVLIVAVVIGTIWAFGISLPDTGSNLITALFGQAWSGTFWTNVIFAILIAAALALVIGKTAKKS